MNKRKSILIGAVLLLLSGAVFADNVLKQKVSWTPETLNLPSLKPGESTTTSAVLTNASLLANQKINGEHLSFQVTNGAGTNITATAKFPKKFEPGQKVTVTLVVSVASSTLGLPPRVISGKVQLLKNENEKEKGKGDERKLFEKSLPINIAVSSIPLPPFPNLTENNATLLGIDSDANGVRDDIDWYVVATYPDSAKIREALKQEARALTPFLRDAGDKAKTRGNNLGFVMALDCQYYVAGLNSDTSQKIGHAFRSEEVFLNTKDRSRAYWKANGKLGGTTDPRGGVLLSEWEAHYKSGCTFNPDSFPN